MFTVISNGKCRKHSTLGNRCEYAALRYYRIIDGKHVEVPKPEYDITVAYNSYSDDDETPRNVSLSSISCTLFTSGDDDVFQKENITQKKRI